MKNVFKLIAWEFRLANRYGILAVALFVTIAYVAILWYFREEPIRELVLFLIFSDPAMLGFVFIGAMVLYEKSANTLSAIAISPIKNWQYLWSKGIFFSFTALGVSIIMIKAGSASHVNYLTFSYAIIATSLFFIFLGFIAVIRVQSFNQYILIIPLFIIPLCYPLVSLFGIFDHWSMYAFPTYAAIILLKAAIQPVETFDMVYAVFFLALSIIIVQNYALRSLSDYLSNNLTGS